VDPSRGESVDVRSLSPGQAQRLAALRRFAALLDSAFVVPGLRYRIGLDPILGLVPGLGDLVSPLFGIGVLWQAYDLGIPRVVQLRMLFNVAIDALVGAVPLVGDVFDFAWKANNRNMALLERHAARREAASAGDWLFVVALTLLALGLAVLPLVVAGWAIAAIARPLL
jgi:hypothetical protein